MIVLKRAPAEDAHTIWKLQKDMPNPRSRKRSVSTDKWKLDTILQEDGNCHLYEKMGYHRTGQLEVINDKMTIIYYEKN